MKLSYLILSISLFLFSHTILACGESAGSDFSICENNLPYIFSDSSDTHWGGSGITAEGVFNPSSPGVYTLTLFTQSSSCSDSDEVTVTVLASPTVFAGADEMVCVFEQFQINATASSPNGNIVVWSWSGDDQYLNSTNISNPIASPSGSASFNLTVADEAGCASFDQINLTTADLPVVDAGSNIEMCHVSDAQSLSGSPSGGIWQGPGVVGSDFISPSVGTHTLEYSYTDSQGCHNSDQISIVVNPLPSIDAGNSLELCPNEGELVLSGYSPSSGVSWSGIGVTNASAGEIDPALMAEGPNEITMSFGSGTCEVHENREIHIHDLPGVIIESEYNICENEVDPSLSGNVPSGGEWSGSIITDSSQGFVDTSLGLGSHSVTYTVQDPVTLCYNSTSSSVEIREVPEADYQVENLACLNSELDITNNSDADLDFSWIVDGNVVSNDLAPSIQLSTLGDYGINLEVTNSFGCFDEGVLEIVEVISEPTANYSLAELEGCEPFNINPTNNSLGSYLSFSWDFVVGSSIETEPLINFGDITEDTSYELVLTAQNNCGSSEFSESILVKAEPEADFDIQMTSLCSPALVQFQNLSSSTSEAFNWNLGDGDTSGEYTPSAKIYTALDTPENYQITLEVSNDCGVSQTNQTIEVLPNIVQSGFSTSTIEVCAPEIIEFNDLSINASNIAYDFNGELSLGSSAQMNYETPGVYEVFQYVTDGCGFDTSSVEIIIHPAPVLEMVIGEDQNCTDQDILFSVNGESVSSIEWTLNNQSMSNNESFVHTFDAGGDYTVSLNSFTQENNCLVELSQDISVFELPVIELEEDYISGCAPYSFELVNIGTQNTQMTWQVANQNSLDNFPNFEFENAGLHDIQVSSTNGFGCTSELTLVDAVEVFDSPTVDFEFSPDELDVLYSPTVDFENLSTGASSFHWDFGDGNESMEINPSHTYEDSGVFPVTLTVTNSDLCSEQITLGLQVEDQHSVFIPNSFTPNGDGLNDVFKPEISGIDYLEALFIVYDRWGQIVYESNSISEPWIGNVKNGSHYAQPGTYSWVITFTLPYGKGVETYNGTVTLIR